MNTNKDSAVRCMITASYILSTMCTIFIFLSIFKRSWCMAAIALDIFLYMGVILISAFIINDCEEHNDVPVLVNIICCIVLAVEYFIMVVGWGIFNIAKYVFMFPATVYSFMINLFNKGDDNNDKN